MWCDDGAEPADDRDVFVVNGIFAAGLILHKQLNQIDNGKASHHVEGALDLLDEALQEIRWAAFVRRRPGPH
jgi:hypothetical protein